MSLFRPWDAVMTRETKSQVAYKLVDVEVGARQEIIMELWKAL